MVNTTFLKGHFSSKSACSEIHNVFNTKSQTEKTMTNYQMSS
jgi:hypothetical protein